MKKKIIAFICTIVSLVVIICLTYISSNINSEDVSTETYSSNDSNALSSLDRLMQGNEKYIKGSYNPSLIDSNARQSLYKNGQKPYAAILTCSDSRVVPEHIFYTGLGEIFVIRVAGNVVDESVMGSLEFAVNNLKVPLVMVMGHQDCGAVYNSKSADIGGSLGQILAKIAPSYEKAIKLGGSEADIVERATDFNVKNSIELIGKNEIIQKYVKDGSVDLVGSNYNLETGKVRMIKALE